MKKGNQKEYIKILLVAVIVGIIGFGLGMKYQQRKGSSIPLAAGQFGNRLGGRMPNGQGNSMNAQRGGFRPVNGEILSSDASSITVQLPDGSSKIIMLSNSTTINKASTASATDLKVGEKVAVFGQENTDGSVTAQSIQLNPVLMGSGRDAVGSRSASPKP